MAIQINQLNTSPLAAVAQAQTGRLGLEPYPIDIGAVAQGVAKGIYKKADLDVLYSAQKNQQTLQKMADSGAMDRTQAQNMFETERKKMDIAYASIRDTADRAIKQQEVDQTGSYQQGMLGVAQGQLGVQQGQLGLNAQELGMKDQQSNRQLDINQQQVNQLGQYQKGTLDVEKQKAQAEQQLGTVKTLMAMKEDQRNVMGSYASVALMASQIKDPAKAQEAFDSILKSGVESGDIPKDMADKFSSMDPMQRQLKLAQMVSLAGSATTASKKAQAAGMSIDESGNIVPAAKASKLDENLDKQDAIAAVKAADSRDSMNVMLGNIKQARQDLAAVPESAMGPVKGWIARQTSQKAQVLESSLNSLALQAKDLFKLGSGQGFTDADRDFLVRIEGGLNNYKGSVTDLLDRAENLANHVTVSSWMRENNIRKGTERYNQWLSNNPAPDVKVKNKEGVVGHISADQLKEALKSGDYEQI